MGLKPHGDIVINVITTKETNEWEEKNESDKKYYTIIWSNDGLIFVTYDYYQTFYEII